MLPVWNLDQCLGIIDFLNHSIWKYVKVRCLLVQSIFLHKDITIKEKNNKLKLVCLVYLTSVMKKRRKYIYVLFDVHNPIIN